MGACTHILFASSFGGPLRYGAAMRRSSVLLLPRRLRFITSATQSESTSDTKRAKRALVIVESPAKARTVAKYVPQELYDVASCVGHVRELPSSAKRIPARYKGEPWTRLGVNVADGFRPLYVLIEGKRRLVGELRAQLADKAELILATDDDREGEAISWHLVETLKPDVPVRRAVFREITRDAVMRGLDPSHSRAIDMCLVRAQEARRILDRLAGYTMSPLLWKKIARGLSAGRVQSVAMAQLVRREQARLRFVHAEYVACMARMQGTDGEGMDAALAAVDGVRLARGVDFDADTGALKSSIKTSTVHWYSEDDLRDIVALAEGKEATVIAVERRSTQRKPPLPLITSTLQQECGNKLGMGAGRTMSAAQKLYENGFITYMRTDNPVMSEQARTSARESIASIFGEEFIGVNVKAAKMPKAAQAAHEAIRPAGINFIAPEDTGLVGDELRVYEVIFRRALASQMAAAKVDTSKIVLQVKVMTENGPCILTFRATGSIVVFPGFLLSTKAEEAELTSSQLLPAVSQGDKFSLNNANVTAHVTKPPPRYNDASIVKTLEELGVGRPSTYATIIEKLIERGYAFRGKTLGQHKGVPAQALVPSLAAFAVERLLSSHFPEFVDAQFTARMESALDDIAAGTIDRTKYLSNYYNGESGLAATVARTEKDIDPTEFRRICLPNLETSTNLLVNSYGPYIERNGTVLASLPKTTLADELSVAHIERVIAIAQNPPVIGLHPTLGRPIVLKTASYGPYVQLGRDDEYKNGEKPKRASLLPGMQVENLDVETAAKLLELPRLVGIHPSSGLEVRVNRGPFGPYISHDGANVALRADPTHILSVGIDECVTTIEAAAERRRRRIAKQAERDAAPKAAGKKPDGKKTDAKKSAAKKTKKSGTVAKKTRAKGGKTSAKSKKKIETTESEADGAKIVAEAHL